MNAAFGNSQPDSSSVGINKLALLGDANSDLFCVTHCGVRTLSDGSFRSCVPGPPVASLFPKIFLRRLPAFAPPLATVQDRRLGCRRGSVAPTLRKLSATD